MYPEIRNERDLRIACTVLHFLKSDIRYEVQSNPIISLKKAIRRYTYTAPSNVTFFCQSEDEVIIKEFLDDEYNKMTLNEVTKWYLQNRYIPDTDWNYDCSSHWFTAWYKIVRIQNKWCIYACHLCD